MKKTVAQAHRYGWRMTNLWVLLALAMNSVLAGQSFATVYVEADAAAGGDGNSWSTAYQTIQEGIDDALDEEVWVAEGTYMEAITMKDGVALYGGFAGTEGARDQRDWEMHVATIDGSTARGGEAAYHVVMMNNITNSRIDGFTITGGNADGTDEDGCGAGIYCLDLDNTNAVANCTLDGNSAQNRGGGIYNRLSSPTISGCAFSGSYAYVGSALFNWRSAPLVTDCTFSGNTAGGDGGGIRNEEYSSPTITNCTFTNNDSGVRGGGINNYDHSSPTVTDCIFRSNSAFYYGGAAYNYGFCLPSMTNCVFWSNTADTSGGGMYSDYFSGPTLTNCTFCLNVADTHGGAIRNYDSSLTITNCILWGNVPEEISLGGDHSTATVIYSDVRDGYSGEGNINVDPLFVDTLGGDLRLQAGSPGLDVATWSGAPDADILGIARPQGAGVDMGAYEFIAPGTWDSDNDGVANGADGVGDPDDDGVPSYLDPDADNDGLSDGDEVRDLDTGTPDVQNPFDPLDPDTTGDGFSDVADGVLDGQNDYDGDGMSNADEFTFGYNPIDPGSWAEVPDITAIGFAMVVMFLGVWTYMSRRLRHKRA